MPNIDQERPLTRGQVSLVENDFDVAELLLFILKNTSDSNDTASHQGLKQTYWKSYNDFISTFISSRQP